MKSRTALIMIIAISFAGRAIADSAPPTFSGAIAKIVHEKCSVCHRPNSSGPFSLITYDEVRSRANTIEAVLDDGYMPPWKPLDHGIAFSNDRSLSKREKRLIKQWIHEGAPEGNPQKSPPPPTFFNEWRLGQPDLVVEMNGEFTVPADGPDIYRSFAFPLDLPEDKWVKAVELQPQARSVFHHAIFFLDVNRNARRLDGVDGAAGIEGMGFLTGFGDPSSAQGNRSLLGRLRSFRHRDRTGGHVGVRPALNKSLGGYVPGSIPNRLPGDLAMTLPKGSDIVMQTHFHPSGKLETEHAKLGLYFGDKPPSKPIVPIMVPAMFGFGAKLRIPPGDDDFRITDSFTLPVDTQAIGVNAHAHYVCKTIKMTADTPDGDQVVLLEIDDWDLDWQDQYLYQQPVALPAGTVLKSEIRYDNSANNAENPFNPPREIRWGRGSNDEMGAVTLLTVPRKSTDQGQLAVAVQKHLQSTFLERSASEIVDMMLQLDNDHDEKLQLSEAPPRMTKQVFRLMDLNNDSSLDRDELTRIIGLRPTPKPPRRLDQKPSSSRNERSPEPARPQPKSGTANLLDRQFQDISGKIHRPFEDKSTLALVCVFISTDCPIANGYQPLLRQLEKQYRPKGIKFLLIHPHTDVSVEKARRHAQDFEIQTPVIIDADLSIARQFGAKITPEAFVFTRDSINPIYQGRIDNRYAGFGKKRRTTTSHDLNDAITAVISGKAPVARKTESVGCHIAFANSVIR